MLLNALPDTPWGLRDRVILSLGYDILARRSELVALKTSDITFRDDGTARVIIRRSKTDQFGAGRFALTSRETASLLKEWLAWRGEEIRVPDLPDLQGHTDQPRHRSHDRATRHQAGRTTGRL